MPDSPRRPAGLLRHWLLTWRVVVTVPAFAGIVTLLFYAEEDWRGWHAWSRYRRGLEAQGQHLDWKASIPSPVPDEQNFAATPFIRSWFDQPAGERWDDDYALAKDVVVPASDGFGGRQMLDLAAWADALDAPRLGEGKPLAPPSRRAAAEIVLRGLATSEAPLAELQAASQRPSARYPIFYNLEDPWGILLPHLANVKKACQRLQLRACAALAAGQTERALADIKLMFYLANSPGNEPFLISHLVRIACMQIALQPVWEGLAERRWSESELKILQSLLSGHDFVTSTKKALDGERAAGVFTVDLVRRKGLKYLLAIQNQTPLPPMGQCLMAGLSAIVPSGWYHQEKLNYCRLHHLLVGTSFDTAGQRISPRQIEENTEAFARAVNRGGGPSGKISAILEHRFLATLLLPSLGKVGPKAAAIQVALDEATLGCALERYRRVNGQFPQQLEALVPKFIPALPRDVISGQRYQYRRPSDQQFVLYSIGWDETDDGGNPGVAIFDQGQGDWLWQYPEPHPDQ